MQNKKEKLQKSKKKDKKYDLFGQWLHKIMCFFSFLNQTAKNDLNMDYYLQSI